jgi:hypothetical protein
MATVTCPSCGLPRAPDLIDAAACPVCGTVGAEPGAAGPANGPGGSHPPLAEEVSAAVAPGRPAGGRSPAAAVGLVGFVVGLAAGVGGTVGWQNAAPRLAPPPQAAGPDTALGPGTRVGSPVAVIPGPPAVAPMPREVTARAAPPVTPPGGGSPPPAREGDPPAEAFPGPVPGRPAALTLDNPDGTSSPHVRPGGTLVLRGKVKKLVVSGLDGGAVLDCSALDAAEVVVVGPVFGRSRLAVRAPAGRVTFVADKGTVGGGAAVEVVAKEVGLHGRVDGAGTRVAVRLADGGTLTFAEVDGPARLEYAAHPPGGPEPRVIAGRVGAGAVVRKVD